MSDDIKLDQEDGKEPLEDKPVESRRRFVAKAGLGGAVLTSLMSRSAFGGGYCTPSIMASYNLSAHPDLDKCKFACKPRHWKKHSWDYKVPGHCSSGQLFCEAFSISRDYWAKGDAFCDSIFTKNVGEILDDGCASGYESIGKHAVAALINCVHDDVKHGCPYTYTQVVTDFQAACRHYYNNRNNTYNPDYKKNLLNQFKNNYKYYYTMENVTCPMPY